MVDVFLILVITLTFFILLITGIYLLIYYQHPDDSNTAYFPKFTVLGGYMLAGTTVLGLPLDVSNNAGYAGCDGYNTAICGGLDMKLFWDIFFWLIPIWVFVLIPFSTFYYEAEDDTTEADQQERHKYGTYPHAHSGLEDETTSSGRGKKSKNKLRKNKSKKNDTHSHLSNSETHPDNHPPPPPPPKRFTKFQRATCNLSVVLVLTCLVFGLSFLFWSHTNVPVRHYRGGSLIADARSAGVVYQIRPRFDESNPGTTLPFEPGQLRDLQPNDSLLLQLVERDRRMFQLQLNVDAVTFYAGLMTFAGWFVFAFFGGIGMAALPMELVLHYLQRPKAMDPEEFAEVERELQQRVNEMVIIGEKLKLERYDKEKMHTDKNDSRLAQLCPSLFQKRSSTLRDFKAAVFLLEQDVQEFTAYAAKSEHYNPLYPYISLFFGILTSLLSLAWILHIIVYLLPPRPYLNFLNTFFEFFDRFFPLFGVLAVAVFTSYLLLCAIKGCFKFGLRFFFFAIYPMQVGETYMSAMLFNIGLILICALPVVQFAAVSFADYARYTTIHQIFAVQIEHVDFFQYFFKTKLFYYGFLVQIFVTFAAVAVIARRGQGTDIEGLRKRLGKGRIALEDIQEDSDEDDDEEDDDDDDDESRRFLTSTDEEDYDEDDDRRYHHHHHHHHPHHHRHPEKFVDEASLGSDAS